MITIRRKETFEQHFEYTELEKTLLYISFALQAKLKQNREPKTETKSLKSNSTAEIFWSSENPLYFTVV